MGNKAFYQSGRWRKKQARILRRDGYLCQESKKYGVTEEATTVHHIWPLEDYPEYAMEDWNLLSLCADKHNQMHDRKTRKLTELGERWRNRTVPPTPRSKTAGGK